MSETGMIAGPKHIQRLAVLEKKIEEIEKDIVELKEPEVSRDNFLEKLADAVANELIKMQKEGGAGK